MILGFSNTHPTYVSEFEQTVTTTTSTTIRKLNEIAKENTFSTEINVGLEVTAEADFLFGAVSATASTELSIAQSQFNRALEQSETTSTITYENSQRFPIVLQPGEAVFIHEGTLDFPGQDITTGLFRVHNEILPEQEEIYMYIPVTIDGQHQGCACGAAFGDLKCPSNQCCGKVYSTHPGWQLRGQF
jgi:hypothetical protein